MNVFQRAEAYDILVRNIVWLSFAIKADWQIWNELRESCIVSLDNFNRIVNASIRPGHLRPSKIYGLVELCVVLRETDSFIAFLKYLNTKVANNSQLKDFVELIRTEFSNSIFLLEHCLEF